MNKDFEEHMPVKA